MHSIQTSHRFRWTKLASQILQTFFLLQCVIPPPHAIPDTQSSSTLKPASTSIKDDFLTDHAFQSKVLPLTFFWVFLFSILNLIPFHRMGKLLQGRSYVLLLPKWMWGQVVSPLYRPWTPVERLSLLGCVFGSVLRQWSMATLAQFFTYTVRILDNHELITSGPYEWLIHPSYTGLLLCLGSYYYAMGIRGRKWVISFLALLSFAYFRIQNEETALANHFQHQWQSYSQQRWRLFVGIY